MIFRNTSQALSRFTGLDLLDRPAPIGVRQLVTALGKDKVTHCDDKSPAIISIKPPRAELMRSA